MIKNVLAGFWIRILAGIIDGITFLILGYTSSFIFQINNSLTILFYYLWILLLIIFVVLLFFIIPLTNKSRQTLGRWICRIEVKTIAGQIPTFKHIFKKEFMYSFLWIIAFILFIIFIQPALFMKIANESGTKITQNKNFTYVEIFLISIPSMFITMINFLQILLTMSLIRKNKKGWNDLFSETQTLYKYKYEEIETKYTLSSKLRHIDNYEIID
ncbi:RDD family protein [Mycoplasma iguanae]|uniref:RDD family protein n=1 Tax=Mycoplasma iguanae TaxID=292461 RepID=A0ABY5RBE5_9MOLU|nr:RDD family protein [Mycoplasma iguanae]UVD81672.1 RDD family protein [Mycoplasma iguanae]